LERVNTEARLPAAGMMAGFEAPSGIGASVHIGYMDFRGAQRGVSIEVRRAIDESRQIAVAESVAAVKDRRIRSHNWARTFGG
jgi:hypothetical protein